MGKLKKLVACVAFSTLALSGAAEKVGLVLSGGGAKGIAHIGVIKALEDNNIPIDVITGTSMGAIVGGLYSAGYTPEEMMSLLRSKEFLDASTGQIDPDATYLFFKPDPSPALINVTARADKSVKVNSILPSSLISPMPMNFSFMSIFSGYTAQCGGDFDDLFVPFRSVASDMTHKRKVIFKSGSLDDAVRASMSFPIVFRPIVVDGAMLYDGGIYDNFPVDVMREEFHPDIMLGVDVHSTDTVHGFPDILSQMDMLVIQHNDYSLPADEGIKLRVDLNQFSLLDFQKADEIYQIGYDKAIEMIDSIKGRVSGRRDSATVAERRRRFKAATPAVAFDSVKVSGATASQNEYLRSLFTQTDSTTLSMGSARDAYARAVSTGRMKDLDPKAVYDPETGRFRLDLKADVKDNLNFGFGGYITSSANSMLYLSAGYNTLSFRSLDANLGGWIGQSYMAGKLDAKLMLRGRRSSALAFEAVVSRQRFYESDKLFYQAESPAFITELEVFTRFKFGFPTGLHSRFDIGAGYAHQNDRFYNNDETIVDSETQRNRTTQDLGQLMARWEYSNLDNPAIPSSGRQIKVMVQGLTGHFDHRQGTRLARAINNNQSAHVDWLQLEVDYRDFFPLTGHFTLGISSTMVASTRKLMKCYNASIVDATAFHPTPSSYNSFNPDMRANSFITAGLTPIYNINDRFSLRGDFHAFSAMRPIVRSDDGKAAYGRWFSRAAFFGEASAVVKFPFATLSVYGNYQTIPGNKWGVGVAFGVFILAPRFQRP